MTLQYKESFKKAASYLRLILSPYVLLRTTKQNLPKPRSLAKLWALSPTVSLLLSIYPNSFEDPIIISQEWSLLPCHPYCFSKSWNEQIERKIWQTFLSLVLVGTHKNIPLGKCAKERIIHPTKLIHPDLNSYLPQFFLVTFWFVAVSHLCMCLHRLIDHHNKNVHTVFLQPNLMAYICVC